MKQMYFSPCFHAQRVRSCSSEKQRYRTIDAIFCVLVLSPPFTEMQISVQSAEQLFGFNSSRKCRCACCCLFVEHIGCIWIDSSRISIFSAKHRQLCVQIIVRIAHIWCNLNSQHIAMYFIIFYMCIYLFYVIFFTRRTLRFCRILPIW